MNVVDTRHKVQSADFDFETMLRRLLRPLIAYLMRRGWGYIAVRDLLKRIYIEEALRYLAGPNPPTDSRVSLITGINRGEVKRLREAGPKADASATRDPMAGVNLSARVVGTWVSASAFRDATGYPLTLSLRNDGDGPSFDALLRTARVDVRARTVIEELQSAGIVERVENDQVRLLRTAYTPDEPSEKMLFLAANVGDHMRSALHNLAGTAPAFIERALFHNNMDAARLEAARPILSEMADRLLRQCNEKLLESSLGGTDMIDNLTVAGPLRRLRLGVYYYETDAGDLP